jgi:ABC-type uncharacterized transport system substrate-binding protein
VAFSDLVDNYRRAAIYADRISRGTKPSELPVQLPVKVQITINLRTAKTLGLNVPSSILLRADEGDRIRAAMSAFGPKLTGAHVCF